MSKFLGELFHCTLVAKHQCVLCCFGFHVSLYLAVDALFRFLQAISSLPVIIMASAAAFQASSVSAIAESLVVNETKYLVMDLLTN